MTATTTATEDTARAERVRNAFAELLTLANLLGAQLPTERYQVTRRVLAARLAAVNALLVEAGAPVLLTRIGAGDVEWGATGTTPGTVVPASSREGTTTAVFGADELGRPPTEAEVSELRNAAALRSAEQLAAVAAYLNPLSAARRTDWLGRMREALEALGRDVLARSQAMIASTLGPAVVLGSYLAAWHSRWMSSLNSLFQALAVGAAVGTGSAWLILAALAFFLLQSRR
jgi:hypothetical protein